MTDKIPGQQNQQANLTPKELQYLKDSICKQFLNKLRSVRGVSKIH